MQDNKIGLLPHRSILMPDGPATVLFDKPVTEDFEPFRKHFEIPATAHADGMRFLVCEWECDMAGRTADPKSEASIVLSNTIDAVSALPPHTYMSRMQNWGFHLLPLRPRHSDSTINVDMTITKNDVEDVVLS